MKKIYFVTGNRLKFAIAKKILSRYGVPLIQKKMETPEIQAWGGKAVSEFSARSAARKLKAPVLKNDVHFAIPALKGFPGPFVKYINHWLTGRDLLKLMKGKKKRTIEVTDFLSYATPAGKMKTWSHVLRGTIAKTIVHPNKGTPIDQVVIWKKHAAPQNTLSEKALIDHFARNLKNWRAFGKYFTKTKMSRRKI